MKNIAQGLSLKKYKGNKHKDGGIMVNALGNKTKDVNKAVAEVEGGEYNYRYNPNNPKDNYILSEQLGIAGMAKQADRFKGNNRIDYNTRTNLLNKSMKLNEMLRVQQEQQPMQMAAFGGKLKKYKPGGLLTDDTLMDDVRMQRADRAVSTPGNELTNVPIQPTAPLLSGSQKFDLPTKVQSVNPKVNNLDVSKEMEQASSPVKQKKNNFKGALSAVSGAVSALGPIGQGVGAAMQLAPYAIDLGKAMFDKTSVQDLQTQGSAMRLPNTTYAKNGGKLNVVPLPIFKRGGLKIDKKSLAGDNSYLDKKFTTQNYIDYAQEKADKITRTNLGVTDKMYRSLSKFFNTPADFDPYFKSSSATTTPVKSNPLKVTPIDRQLNSYPVSTPGNEMLYQPTTVTNNNPVVTNNQTRLNVVPTSVKQTNTPITNNISDLSGVPLQIQQSSGLVDFAGITTYPNTAKFNQDNFERIKEYDTSGISNKGLTSDGTNSQKLLDVVEPPKQKDKLSEMLKSGLMLKGSAMAGSLFSALQPAQKETLRLPDFGKADDAMSRATAFSMNPALNEVEQARGKSQEAIRNMATTAGQLTSNLQSVNQRAGQQAAGLRVQEQQIMNQLAGQKAGYETQKASAIQQELARFDENTLMNKAATQDSRVAFVENINNLGTEIMKQGNEQDIADQQDKLAVQNAKLKIIQSAFENPDIISGTNLESILKMIEKGDYTNIPKLFGQPSDTRRVLKADDKAKEDASKK